MILLFYYHISIYKIFTQINSNEEFKNEYIWEKQLTW